LRYQELYDKFWKAFIFPNDVNNDGGPAFVKFMDRVLAAYEKHFFKYESIIEDIYSEYKRKSPEIVSGFEREDEAIKVESDDTYHELPIYFKNPETGRIEKQTVNSDETKTANIKSRSAIQPHAFTYKDNSRNANAVADLFDSLQKNGFISSNADKRDFRRIFENTSPKVPISWAGTLSELSYLIKQIHNGEELIENLGNNIWKVTGKLFCDSDGNYYDWKRFKGQKKPARAALLDKAVALLK